MSEYKDNFFLHSSFKTFTVELEELKDNDESKIMGSNDIESNDNINSESVDSYDDLNKCNISFLYKIFKDNDEISSSDSDSYLELDFESENKNGNEASYNNNNDEFNEIIYSNFRTKRIHCMYSN